MKNKWKVEWNLHSIGDVCLNIIFQLMTFFIIDFKYAMNFKQQRHMKNKLKNLPKK